MFGYPIAEICQPQPEREPTALVADMCSTQAPTEWRRMSKDEWLDVIIRNQDFFLNRGLDPLNVLRQVNDLKDRGVSDWTIISILV